LLAEQPAAAVSAVIPSTKVLNVVTVVFLTMQR
jgi:hypothetical protein